MSNTYEDDPWGNGWADDTPSASQFISPSQLLNTSESQLSFTYDESKVPSSYKKVYEDLKDEITSGNDFEMKIMNKLVEHHYLTGFQRTKIMNTIYDHNLLPFTQSSKFYQCLGLVALELDLEGSGDYVTLQFKIEELPEIVDKIVDIFLAKDTSNDFTDPLTSQLADTKLDDELIDDTIEDIPPVQNEAPVSDNEMTKYINDIRDEFKVLYDSKDIVNIKEVPEKEGLLFKHINYVISHQVNLGMNAPAGMKKVIRRYSDFVWLLEYLLKKYPFRIIPGLPPKKFTVGASPDSQFLQRRRRGLYRFLNQIIKHPVLRGDAVVVTFLTVPTDLASWKKQAQIDYSLEFKGNKISPSFMNNIWPSIAEDFLEKWKIAESSIGSIIESWTKIVLLVERYERRQQQIAYDNNKFVEMLNKFEDLNNAIYPFEDKKNGVFTNSNKDDMLSINSSINSISDFFNGSSKLIVDDIFEINTSILEKFKNYLDYLYSIVELFDRCKKLSGNNISQLQVKIKENEEKFNRLNNEEADIKGSDIAKLKQLIINDKQEMFQQLNKDWLIKQCCLQEFIKFQETQFLLSELWIDWSKGRTRYQQKLTNLHENMNDSISNDMPLSR
ncbi:sorting nexin Mvp1p [[Candida] jaroonii]|uniref:Sorting nexin Mvp1p n=1 Tax=[Candida] jaroonii TaxID=467808 RepID=A0ACA9YE94_9ASCO|nr:sorting nexin Mvp1p [[Candida] jaroonii]